MIDACHGDVMLLRFEGLAREAGLAHAVTTRPQNYAPHHGCGRDEAVHWRQRVCEILDVAFEALTSAQQVHGAEVVLIEPEDVGRGRDGRASALPFVDGLLTDRVGVPLVLLSADCPLVCVYDPDRPAVGAVHASWRGTVAGAAENLVRQMQRLFDSVPGRLRAAISPSAGPCCYEVSEIVRRVAKTRLRNADACFADTDGRLRFDLWKANHQQLLACGLTPDRIEVAGLCMICDKRFWSHRRDGADAGRNALFVALT